MSPNQIARLSRLTSLTLFLLGCLTCIPAYSQTAIESKQVRPPEQNRKMAGFRKFGLISLQDTSDSEARQVAETEKLVPEKRSRRSGFSLFRLPSRPAPTDRKENGGAKAPPKPNSQESAKLSLYQWKQVAEILFDSSVQTEISAKLNLPPLSAQEIATGKSKLSDTEKTLATEISLRRLMETTGCEFLMVPEIKRLSIETQNQRVVSTWGEVRLLFANSTRKVPYVNGIKSGLPENPPERIFFSSYSAVEKAPFQDSYPKSISQQVHESILKATHIVINQLFKDSQIPFLNQQERVVITPVSAPVRADALVFTDTGRQVIPGALKTLSPDLSAIFKPDLLPLTNSSFVSVSEFTMALSSLHLEQDALWLENDTPNIEVILAVGAKLKADWLLVARVADVELSSAPSEESPEGSRKAMVSEHNSREGVKRKSFQVSREARAVANGALIRISDGKILWQDRTVASMSSSNVSVANPKDFSSAKRLATDATRFSLLQLQRHFNLYRRQFER